MSGAAGCPTCHPGAAVSPLVFHFSELKPMEKGESTGRDGAVHISSLDLLSLPGHSSLHDKPATCSLTASFICKTLSK